MKFNISGKTFEFKDIIEDKRNFLFLYLKSKSGNGVLTSNCLSKDYFKSMLKKSADSNLRLLSDPFSEILILIDKFKTTKNEALLNTYAVDIGTIIINNYEKICDNRDIKRSMEVKTINYFTGEYSYIKFMLNLINVSDKPGFDFKMPCQSKEDIMFDYYYD